MRMAVTMVLAKQTNKQNGAGQATSNSKDANLLLKDAAKDKVR